MTTAWVRDRPRGRVKLLIRGVRDSLARCGLARREHTVVGGETVHIPRVVAAADGAFAAWVQIDLLPGQSAEDVAAHAAEIAQRLGVPQVWVVPLGRSRIRLELPAQQDD